jgi:DNA mismatch repair ATPase MutS
LIACGILAAASSAVPWLQAARWVEPLLLVQGVVALTVRTNVRRVLDATGPVSEEIAVLRDGVALLEKERLGVQGAARTLAVLRRFLTLLEQRDKDWFNLLFLVFQGKTQLCMAIERWRAEHGAQLRDWIEAWGDFEALNALATYAHENPDAVFPDVTAGESRFEAAGLGHPLLANADCVRNDVVLDERTRFYVISGSNMSGKSTLLRAIGLNAVLAYAGAPVRARSLRLARMNVCASLAVLDSLLNGRSRFLAEVERLRLTIELAAGNAPVLFLVDEIFSGTNSRDRRAAAEAVVRTLVERRAVGALSTHDMSLTEIAEAPGLGGANVHMGSREAGDPMDFDYLLKPGVTQETNAIAIARMAGVPI